MEREGRKGEFYAVVIFPFMKKTLRSSATERYATGFSARTGPIRDSFVKFAELKLITVGYC